MPTGAAAFLAQLARSPGLGPTDEGPGPALPHLSRGPGDAGEPAARAGGSAAARETARRMPAQDHDFRAMGVGLGPARPDATRHVARGEYLCEPDDDDRRREWHHGLREAKHRTLAAEPNLMSGRRFWDA